MLPGLFTSTLAPGLLFNTALLTIQCYSVPCHPLQAPELLELVSGRQLLGVVRERRAVQLAQQRNQRSSLAGAAAQQSGGFLAAAAGGTGADTAPPCEPGGAGQHARDCGEGAQQAELRAAAGSPQQPHLLERPADFDPGPAAEPGASASSAGSDSSGSGIAGQHGPGPGAGQDGSAAVPAAAGTAAGGPAAAGSEFSSEEEPEVLELMMGEQLVATAVRCSQVGGAVQQSAGGDGHLHRQARSLDASDHRQQHPQQQPELGSDAALLEVSFFRGERLLGTLQVGAFSRDPLPGGVELGWEGAKWDGGSSHPGFAAMLHSVLSCLMVFGVSTCCSRELAAAHPFGCPHEAACTAAAIGMPRCCMQMKLFIY